MSFAILVGALGIGFIWPGQIEVRREAGVTTWTYRPLWYTLSSPAPVAKPTPGESSIKVAANSEAA